MNPIKKLHGIWRQWRELRRMPLRLEFVVTDYCNLNCKGCTHYSPLAEKEFADPERLERSMEHLGRIGGDKVAQAYLIGGETLLYPRLTEAMEALRRHFPTQELYVFTNGLMLPRMPEGFWEAARRLDIIMAVTLYPVKFDYDAALELCRERGVRTEVFGDRKAEGWFWRFGLDPKKGQNRRLAHFKCYSRGCVSITGGRLYPCSISACVGHLNKACGTDFRHERGDWLNVDAITDIDEVKRLRDNPVPFCGYCVNPPSTVPYGPSRREASEWVNQ